MHNFNSDGADLKDRSHPSPSSRRESPATYSNEYRIGDWLNVSYTGSRSNS